MQTVVFPLPFPTLRWGWAQLDWGDNSRRQAQPQPSKPLHVEKLRQGGRKAGVQIPAPSLCKDVRCSQVVIGAPWHILVLSLHHAAQETGPQRAWQRQDSNPGLPPPA